MTRIREFDYHLSEAERLQVDEIVPVTQAKINMAFRADVFWDTNQYTDCAVALSEHEITICTRSFFSPKLKLLYSFHVLSIRAVEAVEHEIAEIRVSGHQFRIMSPICTRFIRGILRNFILSAPMLPPDKRFHFGCRDMADFPKFRPELSLSQAFQFTFNANCSLYGETYRHEVTQYVHRQLQRGIGVFNMNELPTEIIECGLDDVMDVRVITASLVNASFVYGFSCENVTRDDIVKAVAPLVLSNEKLRVMRLVNTGVMDGCVQLARALHASHNSNIVYWDLSGNRMNDISHFCEALSGYETEVEVIRLNECYMDVFDLTALLDALVENVYLHRLRHLAICANKMDVSHCRRLQDFLTRKEADPCKLRVLEFGPASDIHTVLVGLVKAHPPLEKLRVFCSSFREIDVKPLIELIEGSHVLEELVLDRCSILNELYADVLQAIEGNPEIMVAKLGLQNMKMSGGKLLHFLKVLEEREGLRRKLTKISLDGNRLNVTDLTKLIDGLKQTQVKSVSLCGNFRDRAVDLDTELVRLAEIPTLESLFLRGDAQCKMNTSLLPLVASLPTSHMKQVDVSFNGIGDAGILGIAEAINRNDNIEAIWIDGSDPTGLSPIFRFLDAVSRSSSLRYAPHPCEDIYSSVALLVDEVRERSCDTLSYMQVLCETRLCENRCAAGVPSAFSVTDDRCLDDIIDTITVDMQDDLCGQTLNRHLAISSFVGLPLPYEHVKPANGPSFDEETGDAYVPPHMLDTIVEPAPDGFDTLMFDSLMIRRPDALGRVGIIAMDSDVDDEEEEEEESLELPSAEERLGENKEEAETMPSLSIPTPKWKPPSRRGSEMSDKLVDGDDSVSST